MSDFEMIYMFNVTFDFLFTVLTTFLSVIFAFLVAGVLFGEKLTRRLSIIMTALFTGSGLFMVVMGGVLTWNLSNLSHAIVDKVKAGHSSLEWVGFVHWGGVSEWALLELPILMLAALAAALYFFVLQRRQAAKS